MARVPPVSRIRMLPYCRRDRMAHRASRETRNHMTSVLPRIGAAVQSKLRSTVGKRFSRFVPVAIASFPSSILLLNLLLGVFHVSAGLSGVVGAMTGAAVSYVLSRWAWERKGRPHLLKETLPFWIVAVGTAIVLTLTTKWANQRAIAMDMSHAERVLFVGAAYFLANCVTFLTRFLIFHYILFRD